MSLEKYKLVSEKNTDFDNLLESDVWNDAKETDLGYHVVRITHKGKPRNYISDALQLLALDSNKVVLKAIGRAVCKAVTVAEILKRKVPLHQVTKISSFTVVDIFEPIEEGLDKVERVRYVSCISIKLSKDVEGVDVNDIGYQPPLLFTDGVVNSETY